MKKTLFITAALLTAMTTSAFAYADSEHKQRNHVSFEQMDTNQDGKIAKDEATGRLAENFDKYDTNGDGFISKDELPKRGKHHNGKKHKGMMFKKMDSNNDGKISKAEMNQFFDKLDSNGDGFITKEDMAAQHKQR